MIRDTTEILGELEKELAFIPTVPTLSISTDDKTTELSVSCIHVLTLVQELLEKDKFLLERLKHSESERFCK